MIQNSILKYKLTSPKAVVPKKGSDFAAGYDLYSIEDSVTLNPGERKLFKTGLHIKIPTGYYGRIAPRSGLAFKKGIDVLAGVIDSDYLGEIGIILINLNNDPETIDTSKAIAQIIYEKHYEFIFEEVTELEQTTRSEGGFGSTDNNQKHETIIDKYQSSGGIPIKEKYSEEIKKRNI